MDSFHFLLPFTFTPHLIPHLISIILAISYFADFSNFFFFFLKTYWGGIHASQPGVKGLIWFIDRYCTPIHSCKLAGLHKRQCVSTPISYEKMRQSCNWWLSRYCHNLSPLTGQNNVDCRGCRWGWRQRAHGCAWGQSLARLYQTRLNVGGMWAGVQTILGKG